jgi:catechol 2,3-dioxygenase-like lactoylglutathione lyase family enzyme
MQLTGIHHLTAVSADAPGNLNFYTKVLGMRLVKSRPSTAARRSSSKTRRASVSR